MPPPLTLRPTPLVPKSVPFQLGHGHWDVPDMTEVTEEAYELVEHEVITEEDFRDFVFTNPTTLWTGMNPDFFKGTVVEQEVKKLLATGVK